MTTLVSCGCAARSAEIADHLLPAIAARGAARVLIDLTGAGALDAGSAAALIRLTRAVRLLGARPILTGIGPELARELIAAAVASKIDRRLDASASQFSGKNVTLVGGGFIGRALALHLSAPFFLAQAGGAFNDNLFKQVVLLLSIAAVKAGGQEIDPEDDQWLAMIVFAAPFLMFTGFAGYLSDKFSKRKIIIICKFAEIVIMALGGLGLLLGTVGLGPVANRDSFTARHTEIASRALELDEPALGGRVVGRAGASVHGRRVGRGLRVDRTEHLVEQAQTTVLCSHGPVLPWVVSAAVDAAGGSNGLRTSHAAGLATAEFMVIHIPVEKPGTGIVAVESHLDAV